MICKPITSFSFLSYLKIFFKTFQIFSYISFYINKCYKISSSSNLHKFIPSFFFLVSLIISINFYFFFIPIWPKEKALSGIETSISNCLYITRCTFMCLLHMMFLFFWGFFHKNMDTLVWCFCPQTFVECNLDILLVVYDHPLQSIIKWLVLFSILLIIH